MSLYQCLTLLYLYVITAQYLEVREKQYDRKEYVDIFTVSVTARYFKTYELHHFVLLYSSSSYSTNEGLHLLNLFSGA
jgi:hypothetical protein